MKKTLVSMFALLASVMCFVACNNDDDQQQSPIVGVWMMSGDPVLTMGGMVLPVDEETKATIKEMIGKLEFNENGKMGDNTPFIDSYVYDNGKLTIKLNAAAQVFLPGVSAINCDTEINGNNMALKATVNIPVPEDLKEMMQGVETIAVTVAADYVRALK